MNREHPRGCDQKIRALSQVPPDCVPVEKFRRGHAESLKVCPGLFQSGHVRVHGDDAAVIFSQRCQMGGLSAWCGTCVQNALAGERAEKWRYELGSASLNGKKALPVTGKKLDGSTDSPNFHCIRLRVDLGERRNRRRLSESTRSPGFTLSLFALTTSGDRELFREVRARSLPNHIFRAIVPPTRADGNSSVPAMPGHFPAADLTTVLLRTAFLRTALTNAATGPPKRGRVCFTASSTAAWSGIRSRKKS